METTRQKRSKATISLALVSLALLALIALLFLWADDTIRDQKTQIRNLNATLGNTQYELSSTQTQFAGYQENAEATISSRNAQISDNLKTISNLQSQVQDLEDDVSSLGAQVSNLQDKYTSTHQELQSAQGELNELEDLTAAAYSDLKNLFSWVTDNAYLPSKIWKDIHDECGDPVIRDNDTCYVNTYDLGQYMQKCFDYTLDYEGKDQQSISSLDDFWDAREGDCDDFSLFAAAWLRKEIDRADSACDKVIVVFQDKSTAYCNANGCDKETLRASSEDVFVVCGAITSQGASYLSGAKAGAGHCTVGVSDGRLSPDSKSELRDINLFEPQRGVYYGQTEDEFEDLHALISEEDIIFYSGWSIDYKLTDIGNMYDEFVRKYGL